MTESILDKENLNLSSIIVRVEFGNNSFLFMGDSETENEKTRNWSKIDVLKVGTIELISDGKEIQILNNMGI